MRNFYPRRRIDSDYLGQGTGAGADSKCPATDVFEAEVGSSRAGRLSEKTILMRWEMSALAITHQEMCSAANFFINKMARSDSWPGVLANRWGIPGNSSNSISPPASRYAAANCSVTGTGRFLSSVPCMIKVGGSVGFSFLCSIWNGEPSFMLSVVEK